MRARGGGGGGGLPHGQGRGGGFWHRGRGGPKIQDPQQMVRVRKGEWAWGVSGKSAGSDREQQGRGWRVSKGKSVVTRQVFTMWLEQDYQTLLQQEVTLVDGLQLQAFVVSTCIN